MAAIKRDRIGVDVHRILVAWATMLCTCAAAADENDERRQLAQKEARRRIVQLNGFLDTSYPMNNRGTPSPPAKFVQTVALGDAQSGQQRIVDDDLELLILLPGLKAFCLFRTHVTDDGLAIVARLPELHCTPPAERRVPRNAA